MHVHRDENEGCAEKHFKIDDDMQCNESERRFLEHGFSGRNADVELFMSYVADPSEMTRIMIDLHGGIRLDDVESNQTVDACGRVFSKCVFLRFMFDSFLRACEGLKSLDPRFLSDDFISDVWAGRIRGNWSISFQHENEGKEPYRNRFRKLIASLDGRGLAWTEKFLAPDRFWDRKEAYWEL